jgi:hypothetical protein
LLTDRAKTPFRCSFRLLNASKTRARKVFPQPGNNLSIDGYTIRRKPTNSSSATSLSAIWQTTKKAIKASSKGALLTVVASWTYDPDWRIGVVTSLSSPLSLFDGAKEDLWTHSRGVFRPCLEIPWTRRWVGLFWEFASAN